jgi:hypothetical protein
MWITPRTWENGKLPTSAQFNTELRDNFNYLKYKVDLLGQSRETIPLREIDKIYQNSEKIRFVAVTVGSYSFLGSRADCVLTAYCDPVIPPATIVAKSRGSGYTTTGHMISFIVPPNHYYSVNLSGENYRLPTLAWFEYELYSPRLVYPDTMGYPKLLGAEASNFYGMGAFLNGNQPFLYRATAIKSGTLKYFRILSALPGNVQLGIYDDLNHVPLNLLTAVYNKPVLIGWNNIPCTEISITSGTDYWFAVVSDTNFSIFCSMQYGTTPYTLYLYPYYGEHSFNYGDPFPAVITFLPGPPGPPTWWDSAAMFGELAIQGLGN